MGLQFRPLAWRWGAFSGNGLYFVSQKAPNVDWSEILLNAYVFDKQFVTVLVDRTCGMFGIDDEEFMSFVPLLSLGVDVPINDAIASFLPHLNLSMQTLCQTIMSSLTLHLLKEELYDARARCVWRDLSVCLGFNAEWFEHEEHLV